MIKSVEPKLTAPSIFRNRLRNSSTLSSCDKAGLLVQTNIMAVTATTRIRIVCLGVGDWGLSIAAKSFRGLVWATLEHGLVPIQGTAHDVQQYRYRWLRARSRSETARLAPMNDQP